MARATRTARKARKKANSRIPKGYRGLDLVTWIMMGFEGGSAIRKSWKDRMRELPCFYCNLASDLENKKRRNTVDHVVAQTLGGPDQPDNAVPACKRCNTEKGHMTREEWFLHLFEKKDERCFTAVTLITRPLEPTPENRSGWRQYQVWPELP